mmetsp:Transcript_164897/g.529262  ORF Transcript_164897/g.529262 Transcript_164897/m.529262 type:complete len:210 (+) Transcript_164897:1-630(+)
MGTGFGMSSVKVTYSSCIQLFPCLDMAEAISCSKRISNSARLHRLQVGRLQRGEDLPQLQRLCFQVRLRGTEGQPVLDHGREHGEADAGHEQDAHEARRHVEPASRDQLATNEDQDRGDAVFEQGESLRQLVDDEEHGPEAEHCEDGGGVGEEQVVHLCNDGADGIHGEEQVACLQAEQDEEQHGGAQLRLRLSRGIQLRAPRGDGAVA